MIRSSLLGSAAEKASRRNGKDDSEATTPKRKQRRLPISWKHFFHAASLAVYLAAWVANGVLLQGITSGFGDNSSVSYNKPVAVTWFSYNFMMLSASVVWRMQEGEESVLHFALNNWAGSLGFRRALQRCAVISYMLMLLNVFMVLGLQCISVSLSNAVYQLQTPMTVALSVCCLRRRETWMRAEFIGIVLSLAGVLLIVLPPLLSSEDVGQDDTSRQVGGFPSESCFVSSNDATATLAGVMITVASAMIGGAYFVFWAIFSEQKDQVPLTGRMEFVDTQMTLTMIGVCNLVVGWPVLVGLHYAGIEEFELPQNSGAWQLLLCNGLVEYVFDASCAVAIYMTSPVTVAIVAPLTIPMSMFVDSRLYGATIVTEQHPWCTWVGAAAILGGTGLLEYKPALPCDKHSNENLHRYDTKALIPV